MSVVRKYVDERQFYNEDVNPENYLKGIDLLNLATKTRGNKMLLSFSRGKDSLAMWLYLREHDVEIVPYTMYVVPDLGYQERALQYYEKYFDTKIYRLPHPHFYYLLQNGKYMPPNQVGVMNSITTMVVARDYNMTFIDEVVAYDSGLIDPLPWYAMGMRRADNLPRMRLIEQSGVMGSFDDDSDSRRFFYPIWDWKISDICDILLRYDIKLPVDYELFGWRGTTETISYRRLIQVKNRYPEDFEKMLHWFPLLDSQMFRYEQL